MTKILFRPITGTLAEAMAKVAEIDDTIDALADHLSHVYGRTPPKSGLAVTFYKYDDRTQWKTYLVTANGKPCGLTNGPIRQASDSGAD